MSADGRRELYRPTDAIAQGHWVAELGDVPSHTLDKGAASGRTGSPSVDSAESPSTLGTLYKAFWSCTLILLRTLLAGRSSSISFSLRSYTLKGDFTAGMVSIMVSFEQVGGYCNASTMGSTVFPAGMTLKPTLPDISPRSSRVRQDLQTLQTTPRASTSLTAGQIR